MFAGLIFAIALLASGQSSTVTGTLAGQIVMEGFLQLRIRPVVRRIITRLIAIIPAVIVIATIGESSTLMLLIASQVILSIQLSFALIPLIQFTSSKTLMGSFANPFWVKILAWLTALIVLCLNLKYIVEFESTLLDHTSEYHIYGLLLLPLLIGIGLLLAYIILRPLITKNMLLRKSVVDIPQLWKANGLRQQYNIVGVAIEGTNDDSKVIQEAQSLTKDNGTIVLIHIVGSPITIFHGSDTHDSAARTGEVYLQGLTEQLTIDKLHSYRSAIGYGLPPDELVRIANEEHIELLVMRSHGHRGLKDIIFGSTISPVRHKLSIPIFIVK
jgi:manganese transport protein